MSILCRDNSTALELSSNAVVLYVTTWLENEMLKNTTAKWMGTIIDIPVYY